MGATTFWKDDFEAAGYRPYSDSMKGRGEENILPSERMYQGSMQKRVVDEFGTRYFVNVDFYDFSRVRPASQASRSLSAHVQFSILNEMRRVVNVEGVDGSPAEIEEFFANLWSQMQWGHYEIDRPPLIETSPSPAPLFQGAGR